MVLKHTQLKPAIKGTICNEFEKKKRKKKLDLENHTQVLNIYKIKETPNIMVIQLLQTSSQVNLKNPSFS